MPANPVLADYLSTRRSVGLAFLRDPGPTPAELDAMLTIATRVPDHAKLTPWRLVVFEGEARHRAGARLAELAARKTPGLDDASLDIERQRFLPAPVTVGVVFSPRPLAKAPEMEQLLSAGNVCFNLLHAAHAYGFGASWVTRWFAFDPAAQQLLGARGGERFVGFVHIGTPTAIIEDRTRPSLAEVVTRWQG